MAYAAVISLKRTIDRLTNPTIINPQSTKSAYDKLKYLQGILEESDARKKKQSFDIDAINAVDADIRDAVWKAEDVIESYAFYHSLPPSDTGCPQLIDIKGVEQELHSFIETAEKLGWIFSTELNNPLVVEEDKEAAATSPLPDFISGNKSTTTTTIGQSDELESIRNQLVCESNDFEVVSLVGMAGIGKTHLAAEIYHDPLVVERFGFRTWVRVGQKPRRVRSILAEILAQIEGKHKNFYMNTHVHTLSQLLKRSWPSEGYLIVLDDIWSADICYDLMLWLPVNGHRRFLLTTRLEELEIHDNKIHRMQFLDTEKSWELFWQNVQTGQASVPPPQLEKVGRKIAENCEGLPLLIIAVANILRGLDKTEEYRKTKIMFSIYGSFSSDM